MAGSQTIGELVVEIAADAREFAKDAFDQVSSAAEGIGGGLRDKASQWGESIKSTLGGAFQTVTIAAAAAAAAAIGFIGSYVDEALAASDATDKFKSTLQFAGKSAEEIEALTAATQKYADQTVYELSDIQNATAQLAANGVKDYDRLAEAAGNLNAVAGGNADTYGTVTQVMTQTASAGKLVTENWRQLTDAIPGAAGRLKDAMLEAGAYTGDFSDAMANGEITAEEFNDAIMALGFEDVAVQAATSTSTFEGAWGNLEAAITGGLVKIIEPLKGPLTSALSDVADGFTKTFDKVASVVAGISEIFTSGDFNPATWGEGISEDSPLIDFLFDLKENASSILSGLGPVLGGLGGMLGPLLSGLPVVGNAFTGLTGPVGLVIGLFTQMVANSSDLQAAFGTVFSVLGEVAAAIAPIFTTLMSQIGPILGQLGDSLAPVIETLALALKDIIMAVLPALMPLIEQVGPVLSEVATVVGEVLAALLPLIDVMMSILIPTIQALLPVVQVVFDVVVEVIQAALEIIRGVIQVFSGLLSGDWNQVWEGIKQVLSGVWDAIVALITGAVQIIGSLISAGLSIIKTIWSSIWEWVKSFASSAWSGITSAISSGISSAVSYVQGLPGKIKGVFSNAGSWLLNAGKKIIDGFINGIKGAFNRVRDTLSSLTSMLPDWKGPADKDEIILRPAGRLVMEGFQKGLAGEFRDVENMLAQFTNDAARAATLAGSTALGRLSAPNVSARSGTGRPAGNVYTGDGAVPSDGGPTVNITNNYPVGKRKSEERDEVAAGIRLAAAL